MPVISNRVLRRNKLSTILYGHLKGFTLHNGSYLRDVVNTHMYVYIQLLLYSNNRILPRTETVRLESIGVTVNRRIMCILFFDFWPFPETGGYKLILASNIGTNFITALLTQQTSGRISQIFVQVASYNRHSYKLQLYLYSYITMYYELN